jgi:hypothetical protein
MIKIFILSILAVLLFFSFGDGKPEFSLMTGNNCLNCHISPNGGGQRSVLGAYARNTTSLIKEPNMTDFFDAFNEMYSFDDGKFLWGFDSRIQTARMGDPSDSKRKYFLMQVTPYLTYFPTEWLRISGAFNLLYLPYMISGESKAMKYQGQRIWSLSAILQPTLNSPSLKMGYFSPSIGTKYDDHTMLIRQVWTGYPQMIIPPDNNEIGAELSYSYHNRVMITAGIYGAESLSEIKVNNSSGNRIPVADANSLSYMGKLTFTPRFFDNGLNTYFGGSYLINGDYNILSVFGGLGINDKAVVLGEMTMASKEEARNSVNYMVEGCYQLINGLMLLLRYESASTVDLSFSGQLGNNENDYLTKAYVIGASINPLPNIEIRPEYRILDRRDFDSYAGQWALQLHIFY